MLREEEDVKGRFALIGTLALLLAGVAQAKTLEEILKEKGVITEQEAKDAQKLVTYRPGAGFSLFSGDEFSLNIGGRVQAQYEYFARDSKVFPTGDTSSFRLRRVYLWWRGYAFTKDLTFFVLPDMAVPNIADGWINYRFMEEAQVQAGQFIVPYTRQEMNSSATLQFVDRSIVTDFYKPSYDLGAMAWGKVANGLVNWNVSASNGAGQNVRRTTPNNAYTFRVAVNPLGDFPYAESDVDFTAAPLVSVAGSFLLNKIPTNATGGKAEANLAAAYETGFLANGVNYVNTSAGGTVRAPNDVLDLQMFEIDAAFKWMGIFAQGEYMSATAKGKNSGAKLESNGWYVQGGYTVLPKTLEIVARYAELDPNTDSFRTKDKRTEVAGGVNYYFAKQAWKVQASVYSLKNEAGIAAAATNPSGNTATTDLRMQLQAQLIF